MPSNDLAYLNQRLSVALRDTSYNTWDTEELDNLITDAVANLWPRLSRELPYGTCTVTLVASTYVYDMPAPIMALSRVDWINTVPEEMGPLTNGSWELMGDPYSGNLKLHVSPAIADSGGTLKLIGYGRYGFGVASQALTTSAASDDILDTTVAHGLAAGDRISFTALTGGSGLSTNTIYHVISTSLAAKTAQFSATAGGSAQGWTTDITAGTVVQHHYPPNDHVPLVLAVARAEAYRRLAASRVQFEQWASRQQNQDTSVGELLGFINEADAEANRLSRKAKTWQRPVPGRHG